MIWKNCPTPDCQWKVCMWAGLDLCYQCSKAKVGKEDMERRYAETHYREEFIDGAWRGPWNGKVAK